MTETKHDLHEALAQAATEPKTPEPMTTGTYRIETAKKEQAEQICRANGTTISAFLRKCVHGLVDDYIAPPRE